MIRDFSVLEVFSWLLEVSNDTKEYWDGGRIIWSVSYVNDGPKLKTDFTTESSSQTSTVFQEEGRKKIVAKLEILKDDIQAVLPIAKVCYCSIYEIRNPFYLSKFYSCIIELGAYEHGCSHRKTSVASHESIYSITGRKDGRCHITNFMSDRRRKCYEGNRHIL